MVQQRSGAVLPVVVVLLGLLGCTPAATPAASATPGALHTTACTPYTAPRDAADVNAVVSGFRDQPLARGGDVGADVTLHDGRRLWVFGDTLRQIDGADTMVRNSMLLFGGGCAQVLLPAGDGAVIPDRGDGIGYWPMSIAVSRRDGVDLVGVMSQRVRAADGTFGFENLGAALAVFRVADGELPALVSVTDFGPDSADTARAAWGAAAWIHSDGYVYLYGTSHPDRPLVFGWALSAARVRVEDVLDQAAWRYWDGGQWQQDPARAVELVPAEGGVSQTLSVLERDGTWYAVSKRDDFLGKDLVVWSAPGPTGPFTPHATGVSLPSDPDSRTYRYMPLAHPDLPAPAGHVVVSYSRGSDDLARLARDPALYRPRFLTVRLPTAS